MEVCGVEAATSQVGTNTGYFDFRVRFASRDEDGFAVAFKEVEACAVDGEFANGFGRANFGGEKCEGDGNGTRGVFVKEVTPISTGVGPAAEVVDEFGASDEFVREVAQNPFALVKAVGKVLLRGHAPNGHAGGGFIVGNDDILNVALAEVNEGGFDVGGVAVVNGQDVNVVGDASVEEVGAEVLGPKSARHLDTHFGVVLANFGGADAAEVEIGLDRRGGDFARHDFVEPFETPEASLEVLGKVAGGALPFGGFKGERKITRGVHTNGHDP